MAFLFVSARNLDGEAAAKEVGVRLSSVWWRCEGFKTEHRHRGMKFGIAPHSPDDWGRQLAAGGGDGSRTRVRKPFDITFSVGSLFFKFPPWRREQTRFSSE